MARRVLIVVLILAIAIAALILAPIEFAAAQRGGFFGPPQGPPPPAPVQTCRGFFCSLFSPPFQPVPQRQPPRVQQPQSQASQQPAPVAKAPVAKDPQARKVLVVGDFVATVVAAGLDQTFADEAKLRFVDKSNPNSGLSRQDYYDWNKVLPDLLAAERPDIVVVDLGANDRQTQTGSSTAQWGTPEWDNAYGMRVATLAGTLSTYGAPFFWLGTVPMRSTPEADMVHINDLTRPLVKAVNGIFVDAWDGFADENGHLVISGPDVDGQIRQLRSTNGINFTDAGQAKLAFFVAREIRRQTGLGLGTVDLLSSLSPSSRIEVGPDGRRRVVGPVISLTDPQPAAGTQLVGDSPVTAARGATPATLLAAPKDPQSPQALLIQGAALPVVPGRADDFTWPRKATPPAASSPAVQAGK